jgi:hypothetical protein
MLRHRLLFAIVALISITVFFITCTDAGASTDPRGAAYAGGASCISCHKSIADSYQHTPHHNTSSKASFEVLKSMVNDTNSTAHYEDSVLVRLEAEHASFYQSLFERGKNVRSEKIDIAIGSGEKAQTFASWKNGQLFELPLTFFAAQHRWTNSPGYPLRKPYFERVILARCFECHGSFASKTDIEVGPMEVSEKISERSLVLGIDCERCHGPAAAHVKFQQENPDIKQAKFIASVKSLSRQQKLDVCGACHSGNDIDVQRSLFAFKPGDSLSNFYIPSFGTGSDPDVHGKQMQLLRSSKCFQLSEMTCNTCHNTHETEDDKRTVFVSKCMNCHQTSAHAVQLQTAEKSCMDCHMPLQASKALDFNDGRRIQSLPYLLRNHRIAVY